MDQEYQEQTVLVLPSFPTLVISAIMPIVIYMVFDVIHSRVKKWILKKEKIKLYIVDPKFIDFMEFIGDFFEFKEMAIWASKEAQPWPMYIPLLNKIYGRLYPATKEPAERLAFVAHATEKVNNVLKHAYFIRPINLKNNCPIDASLKAEKLHCAEAEDLESSAWFTYDKMTAALSIAPSVYSDVWIKTPNFADLPVQFVYQDGALVDSANESWEGMNDPLKLRKLNESTQKIVESSSDHEDIVLQLWQRFTSEKVDYPDFSANLEILELEEARRRGKIVFEKCEDTKDQHPIMFPPFPNYHKLKNSTQYEAYQAEVKVYRSLENLKEDIIVLHDLIYKIPSGFTGKKFPNEQTQEIDFVAIGKNFVVIIAVLHHSDLKYLEKSLEIKMRQVQNQCEIIRNIMRNIFMEHVRSSKKLIPIEWYCALPNLPSTVEINLPKQKLSKIIFRDHISMGTDGMKGWWQKNTKDRYFSVLIHDETEKEQTDRLSEILIGLSNINFKKSLGKSIMKTYNELNRKTNEPPDPLISLKLFLTENVLLEQEDTIKKELSDVEKTFEKTESEIHAHLPKHEIEKITIDQSRSALRASVGSPVISAEVALTKYKNIKQEEVDESYLDNDEIFQRVTGIQQLTRDQKKVVASQENRLLIDGPVGSGKSVIIMGKIIQLIIRERKRRRSPQKRVLLFTTSDELEASRKLEKAGLETHLARGYDLEDLLHTLALSYCKRCKGTGKKINTGKCYDCPLTSEVVVACIRRPEWEYFFHELLSRRYSSYIRRVLDTFYVFIDNINLNRPSRYLKEFLILGRKELVSTSLNQDAFLWISCDHALLHPDYHSLKKFETRWNLTRVTLSSNLRNPVEIYGMLSQIEKVMSPELLSRHVSGNWLHGPRPVIHIIKESEMHLIERKINGEIAKIFDTADELTFSNRMGSGVAVLMNDWGLREEVLNSLRKDPRIFVTVASDYYRLYSYCSEGFPAVIVLMDASFLYLKELYFAVSRAVVYCSVILYNYKETSDEKLDFLLQHGFREMTKPELRPQILFN